MSQVLSEVFIIADLEIQLLINKSLPMFTQDDNQQVVLPTSDDSQVQSGGVQPIEPKIEDTINSYEPPQDAVEISQPDTQNPSSVQSSRTTEDNLAELEKIVSTLGDETEKPSTNDDFQANQDSSGSNDVFSSGDIAGNHDTQLNSQPDNFQNNNASVTSTENSEALADQNIFFLLGAEKSPAQEQEKFLDELQATIWEDFVLNDMGLLLTTQEKEKADEISNNSALSELQKQEQLLDYLDGLIPDLEAIMLEKALELKQDLVKERVESLKEVSLDDQQKQNKIQEVELLLSQGRWYSAGNLLNQIDQ